MDKKINIVFTDKMLESRCKVPLVGGDKNAYTLLMDSGKYPDAKHIFIYAKRADGEVLYDTLEIEEQVSKYILKQSIYNVPGEVTLRIVLKDDNDSTLTAAVIRFNAIEGVYSEDMAEDMGSLEDLLVSVPQKADKATTLAGYGITDSYTKEEIDRLVSGVYRFCGSATVNMYTIIATPQRAGDVFHIALGGEVSQGANVSIPIRGMETDGYYMYLQRTEYDNILAITAADPNCFIGIGEKGKGYSGLKAYITNAKICYIDENEIEMSFEFIPNSPIQEVSEIDIENWEISYMDHSFTLESGDNVAWTGNYWDKL